MVSLFILIVALAPAAEPSGEAIIRGSFGASEIVITTTARLAGAIHSVTWNGQEFIDSHDHGRQLQSACSFDGTNGGEFWAERFNPTEAGSRADGVGNNSSSRLLRLVAMGNELRSTTQMAFWLAPGEKSSGRPAWNDKPLSDHLVTKHVRIGYRALPNVLEYNVTFTVPTDERHHYAQFEALTGYMPPVFQKFWTFDLAGDQLAELSDGPGEQSRPVVFATASGSHAMGIYSPDQPSRGYETAGYGRFRFAAERVVKWNCVFRQRDPAGITVGERSFRLFVAIGTRDDVRHALKSLLGGFSSR